MTEVKKQFVLMVDETSMALLSKLMPSLMYVEVRGIPMTDNLDFVLLGTPNVRPVVETPEVIQEEVEAPKPKGKRKAK
jgi:hypothetical protein